MKARKTKKEIKGLEVCPHFRDDGQTLTLERERKKGKEDTVPAHG